MDNSTELKLTGGKENIKIEEKYLNSLSSNFYEKGEGNKVLDS
jgi:hypothetical protein